MALSIFSHIYWSSVVPLWRRIYSGPLSIFNQIVCGVLFWCWVVGVILLIFLLLFSYSCHTFFYCCSLLLHPHSLPTVNPPSHCLWPWVLYSCSLTCSFLYFPLLFSLSSPLWSLSVCSLFPCLWFNFARFCVLLIRFHFIGEIIWYLSFTAWLISFRIMLSIPSMLLWKVGVPLPFLLYSIPLCKCTTGFWSTYLLMTFRLFLALGYCK